MLKKTEEKTFLFQGSLKIFIFKIKHSEDALGSKGLRIPISKIISSRSKKTVRKTYRNLESLKIL